MTFSDRWHSLSREAQFAAQSMGLGATALGNANYAQTANYAQMLFSLSIGLERAAKLVLCLSHVTRHNQYPVRADIRKYGHDLRRLLAEVDGIGATLSGTQWPCRLPRSTICDGIITILSEFATNITRYYNFDSITSGGGGRSYDPVAAWHMQVSNEVLRKHLTPRQRNRIIENARNIGTVLGESVVVLHSSEDRTAITDVLTASTQTGLGRVERPYTRMYILQICRFVASVIVGVSDNARIALSQRAGRVIKDKDAIPDMREIFRVFFCDDKAFRAKKRWSIY